MLKTAPSSQSTTIYVLRSNTHTHTHTHTKHFTLLNLVQYTTVQKGRDSVVVLRHATDWTVRGWNPSGGEIFLTRPDRHWITPSLLCSGYQVIPWAKTAGALLWPSTPSSAEVKDRVELHFYSSFGPLWPVPGRTLPLFTTMKMRARARAHTHTHTHTHACTYARTQTSQCYHLILSNFIRKIIQVVCIILNISQWKILYIWPPPLHTHARTHPP